MKKVPEDLFNALYKYYPVGMPLNPLFEKTDQISAVVDKKLSEECNNPASISNKIFESISILEPALKWENATFIYYPNYIFGGTLSVKEYEHVKHYFSVQVVISLLCDYYTIYFEDLYKFLTIADTIGEMRSVFSFSSSKDRISSSLINNLSSKVEEYLPAKSFIDHYILRNTKITGVVCFQEDAWKNPADNEYSLYQLMFSNRYVRHFDVYL